MAEVLPTDAQERKKIPLASGVFDYFPAALIEVAKVSYVGNEQHNPGQKLHWSRNKSADHADTMLRHFAERGTIDIDNTRHLAKAAWRILAMLQLEMEEAGAPIARGAKVDVAPAFVSKPVHVDDIPF
jgi:dATP/dGTP diphosphohydrolase